MTRVFFNYCIQQGILKKSIDLNFNVFDEALFIKFLNTHRLELFFIYLLKENNVLKKICNYPYQHYVQRHLMMSKRLVDLSQMFAQEKIQHVFLKGVPLNTQLYEVQCVRLSKDIDILIHPHDLSIAHQQLLKLNYRLCSDLTLDEMNHSYPQVFHALKDVTYRHAKDNTEIELHWNTTIVSQLGFKLADVYANHKFLLIQNIPIPILNNEYNFVYLCMHGALSHWQRLQWLVDIAVFYKKYDLSWEKIIQIAGEYYALRAMLEAKKLLKLYGIELGDISSNWRDKMAINLHLLYTKYLWWSLNPTHSIVAQPFLLLLFPRVYQKTTFIMNRLLFRRPCREKLKKDPHYPLWKLFFIGIFSFKRSHSSSPSV